MKKIKIAAIAAGVVVLGTTLMTKSLTASTGILEMNVEALAQDEKPVLDNTHMYLWWVTEHFGGAAITCTYGGDLPCE